jgi:anaerobic ribonucleoside-triphosphate reductase activating protein
VCAQDFSYGEEFTIYTAYYIMELLKPDYIAGITILGGEPLEPENVPWLRILTRRIQDEYCRTKTVWLYSGYTYEELEQRMEKEVILRKLMENVDVLVDGPYIEDKRDITLKFRGSRNQRILDLKKTLAEGDTVFYEV